MPPPRRRRGPRSWLDDFARRSVLESQARSVYPDLDAQVRLRPGGLTHIFEATVPVTGYEARRVRIEFKHTLPEMPWIYADGPSGREASPHRYSRHRLCVWFYDDEPDRRWVPDDGLHTLFAMASMHLFKEAYWREHGEWLGDEAPHAAWDTDRQAGAPASATGFRTRKAARAHQRRQARS